MKFFGFKRKRENESIGITELDRQWVEDNFAWLAKTSGYPKRYATQFLFTNLYFPETFHGEKVQLENLVKDICKLLDISSDKIQIELISDISETYGMPFSIEGTPFETTYEASKNQYKIYIANRVTNHTKQLLTWLEFTLVSAYCFHRAWLMLERVMMDFGKQNGVMCHLCL